MSASVTKYPFVALVTGANRGLGLEFVRQLVFGRSADHPVVPGFISPETGASDVPSFVPNNAVVIATARDPASATALNALAAEAPDRVFVAKLEATNSDDIAALVALVDGKFGRLDLLINNAAILGSTSSPDLTTISVSEVMHVINVNAMAPIVLSCALLPVLKRTLTHKLAGAAPLVPKFRGDAPHFLEYTMKKEPLLIPVANATEALHKEVSSGARLRTHEEIAAIARSPVKVVFVTSTMGSVLLNNSGSVAGYRASKSTLNSLVRSFAASVPGIAVVPVSPGWVATDLGSSAGPAPVSPPESIAGLLSVIDRAHAGEFALGVWEHEGCISPF